MNSIRLAECLRFLSDLPPPAGTDRSPGSTPPSPVGLPTECFDGIPRERIVCQPSEDCSSGDGNIALDPLASVVLPAFRWQQVSVPGFIDGPASTFLCHSSDDGKIVITNCSHRPLCSRH